MKILRWSLALILVSAGLLVAGVGLAFKQFVEGPLTEEAAEGVLVIERGDTLTDVAGHMADQGLVDHPRFLVWFGRMTGDAARIQAGEFRVETSVTPAELLEKLAAGEVIQHGLTIVEGWNLGELRAAVAGHEALRHTLGSVSDAELMAEIGREAGHAEGRFLPDTYHFPRDTTDREFLRRAARAMDEKLAQAWEGRDEGLPFEDPYEALILASIVEKETAVPAERARIAGVFVNRLERGMRLQTDPTVIYGLGEGFDGNLTRAHLRSDTPYNTYTRRGLPPTPIAMPGTASLEAVVHPAETEAVYFVSRGDGTHVFSETLDEHQQAVRRYQLKEAP